MANSASTPGETGSESRPRSPATANRSDPPLSERLAAPGSRARQRQETRERIFEAALREFRDMGVAGAQIDRIAKNAGIARGTFYFHFPAKDDVILELAQRINARIVQRVRAIAETKPSLPDLLLRLNDALIEEHARVSDAGLGNDVLALFMRRPEDIRDASHPVPPLTEELGRQLHAIAEGGDLRSGMPPEELAVLILSSLFGVLARVPAGEPVRRVSADLVGILARGLESNG